MCVCVRVCVRAEQQSQLETEAETEVEVEPNFLPPNDKLSNLLVSVGDNNCKKFAQNNLIISAA